MTTRRDFLKTTATGAVMAGGLALTRSAFAEGSETLKIGLVGCGGRGTGAIENCLNSASGLKVVSIGDVFQYRTDGCRKFLTGKYGDKTDLPESRCHVGLDAIDKVLADGVDYVILATPPGFRPYHLEKAVAAGKNIFTEKPVGVDGPGIRRVLAAYEEAKKKKLAIVAGTQRRHQKGYLETLKRVHDGAIGDIVSARAYWNGTPVWFRKREAGMSDIAYQCNNWYQFVWTCGDHIVEQHVHNLDVINWAMNAVPASATGMGGRTTRPEGDPNEVGQIFDHFAVEYVYPNGVVLNSFCRQINNVVNNISEALVGTKGRCQVNEYTINGERVGSDNKDPYVQEHTDLIASIRKGEPLNELKTVAESTLTAILGRMATYSGQEVTWEQALNSQDETFPKDISWEGSHPISPPAVPGKARTRPARKK
jgi:myo-inositol 2-dehydrogenase/D-chiro-inositol 1-dehydrogenase